MVGKWSGSSRVRDSPGYGEVSLFHIKKNVARMLSCSGWIIRALDLYYYLKTVSTDKYLSNKRTAQIHVLDFFWSNVLSLLIKEKFLFVIDTKTVGMLKSQYSNCKVFYTCLPKALVTQLEFVVNVICHGMFSQKLSETHSSEGLHRVISSWFSRAARATVKTKNESKKKTNIPGKENTWMINTTKYS